MKPMLKPPGTRRLKLNCDKLLSTFAFKFNLRRYNMAALDRHVAGAFTALYLRGDEAAADFVWGGAGALNAQGRWTAAVKAQPLVELQVGRCRLNPVESRVESAWCLQCNQRLKLIYDDSLSNFAFNFDVRAYIQVETPTSQYEHDAASDTWAERLPARAHVITAGALGVVGGAGGAPVCACPVEVVVESIEVEAGSAVALALSVTLENSASYPGRVRTLTRCIFSLSCFRV